jgi:uncharacterized protein (DUF427 family)
MNAVWNDKVIAESDQTVVVEGNHYFPPECVQREYLRDSSKTTTCSWKGTASYYDLVVDSKTNADAAWFYATPLPAAQAIQGRIAFWKGVQIVSD